MEFTGTYYNCLDCGHIWDYDDDACPECGCHNETELNAKEVNKRARQLLIIRDFNKNQIGKRLIEMLKSHDDFKSN